MPLMNLLWHEYRYFDYERRLAWREVEAILGSIQRESPLGLEVNRDGDEIPMAAAALTYFKAVTSAEASVVPDQAKLEASVENNGRTWNPSSNPFPSLRRQSTRYSAHGLHEYRGKFNPQVVRAVGHLLGLGDGAWILDPFCGSGTVLLEGCHIGWNCVGVDVNPLGVMIANAKVSAYRASPQHLQDAVERLRSALQHSDDTTLDWRRMLPNGEYLERWFTGPVLTELATIIHAIKGSVSEDLHAIFLVILSDLCREVSMQDPDDLRIRRRWDEHAEYDVTGLFLDAVERKLSTVQRARRFVEPRALRQIALLGDSRIAEPSIQRELEAGVEKFDGAITSPPYASALPYIDTQRLSLALLGLVDWRQLRALEERLIGNREIRNAQRLRTEEELRVNTAGLPPVVIEFCRHLLVEAVNPEHGFRKMNVPSLVYQYFADMARMFQTVHGMIREGGKFALLVGRNQTELNGNRIVIDTPDLLAEIARSKGWSIAEAIEFDAYHRYNMHQQNSIRQEQLIVLVR